MGHATDPQAPTHDPRTAPLPKAGQAALDRLARKLTTPARWPGEITRHGNTTITHTPHTPWPYGTACHTCHHTSVHRTQNDATTATHTCRTPRPAVNA